jgi:hypothetical protein
LEINLGYLFGFSIATGFSQWIKNEANSIGFSQNCIKLTLAKAAFIVFFQDRQLK